MEASNRLYKAKAFINKPIFTRTIKMVENIKRDIPGLGYVNEIIHWKEWKKRFGYNKKKRADYLVTYNKKFGLGNVTLIESSVKSLQRKLCQIRESHDFFRNVKPPDTLLIVLDSLSSRDDRKFKLKSYKNNKYLHFIHRRSGRRGKIKKENEKSKGKDIFLLYRSDFGNLVK
ncbi:hypothetical protein AYK26_07850 [Euryarchaeota archaeon SM23-78]|nr:MAG: hypothetical protein AYK26_07850 [Euryarchaeota archaeon SM23-78]